MSYTKSMDNNGIKKDALQVQNYILNKWKLNKTID